MKNFTIYLTVFLFLVLSKTFSQETFESKAKTIASKIESITKEEKSALKLEVESVNMQLQNGSITKEQADEKKLRLAETRAKSIEFRVSQVQEELNTLVQEKVDGKIKSQDSSRTFLFHFGPNKNKISKDECRTTSQLVLAFGLNNLATDKKAENSDFKYWDSHFYEWGVSFNTRILKNNNLLHAKYGMSVMYNNLRATDNRLFAESGKQTNLITSPLKLESSRFRNVYLVVPMHLEFDFSGTSKKEDKRLYKIHQAFRLGIGGYAGFNVKSKQIVAYEDFSGNDVKQITKGDYNVNDFIYGASFYMGYKEICLYAKYDISPLFKNNAIDQNNISLGLRFDFN